MSAPGSLEVRTRKCNQFNMPLIPAKSIFRGHGNDFQSRTSLFQRRQQVGQINAKSIKMTWRLVFNESKNFTFLLFFVIKFDSINRPHTYLWVDKTQHSIVYERSDIDFTVSRYITRAIRLLATHAIYTLALLCIGTANCCRLFIRYVLLTRAAQKLPPQTRMSFRQR